MASAYAEETEQVNRNPTHGLSYESAHENARESVHTQYHAEGGRNKGGRKQMRANANKRRQTLRNASKRRGENASKRKQTRANTDKRKQTLAPPLLRSFTPSFAIPFHTQNLNSHEAASLCLEW